MTLNRKAKDSVFTSLFKDKTNILQMYTELHPEDKDLTPDDINVQTLESVMVNTIYNDLGFIVKDRCVVLIEAQSVWNPNIVLRMLFYLVETFRRYLDTTNQSIHSSAKVKLPKPELYIIYPGTELDSDIISLNDCYFFDEDPVLNVKVRIINKANTETLSGQYIGFCKVYNEQSKLFSNSIDAAQETYRICIKEGYLKDFLIKHKSEAINMMSELFDEERLRKQYDLSEKTRNFEEGKMEGLKQAFDQMIKNGIPESQARKILNIEQ